MDINAASIARGTATIEEAGWQLSRFMLDAAGGDQMTRPEQREMRQQLVVVDPAPMAIKLQPARATA